MTTQAQDFNPAIVECLRILYRRGRAVREARERKGEAGDLGGLAASPSIEEDEPRFIVHPPCTLSIHDSADHVNTGAGGDV